MGTSRKIDNELYRVALTVAGLVALCMPLSGCQESAPPLQVCHAGEKGMEILEVSAEAELREHVDHGDSFGTGIGQGCAGGVSFRIDQDIEMSVAELPGYRGGKQRPVGVLVDSEGRRDEYVANEIEVHFNDKTELESFLNRYNAAVLRDDTALVVSDDGETNGVPGGLNGWYLVEIGSGASALSDLPALAAEAGLEGVFSASSEETLRAFALFKRESAHRANLNLVPAPDALLEHPLDNMGNFYDEAQEWWMTEDDDPGIPGEQGLSVGIEAAFKYLRETGLPPRNGTWQPARIVVIDSGFDLDPVTGLGNPDYSNNPFQAPLQLDFVNGDDRAGGMGGATAPWHGQGAFGVCCAYPRNGFGGAGTGGEYVRPVLFRGPTFAETGDAIRSASLMGADVVTMSFGLVCNVACTGESRVQEAIDQAALLGTVIFASAGNGQSVGNMPDRNIDGVDRYPCELNSVICVGAVDQNGDNVWNWGANVDIWAPTNVRSTVTPASAALDADDIDTDEVRLFGGTSAAAPFAAGVGAMMKAANHDLTWQQVQDILQQTANTSPGDTTRVLTGYVDAFRAVQAVRDNPPPSVKLAFLLENGTYAPMRQREFSAFATDEVAYNGFIGTVEFYSDIDGLLCAVEGKGAYLTCDGTLRTEGQHVITAVATDEFGATGSSKPVEITVANRAPSLVLANPVDGSIHYADQQPSFRATVYDADGERFENFCPGPDGSACVEWYSSVDGYLGPSSGSEDALNFTTALSKGTHAITATARDAYGATASQSTTVHVVPGRGVPTARILNDLDEFTWTEPMVLRATASDPEDGTLPSSSFEWYSNVDGFLGSGDTATVELSGPRCEGLRVHIITLYVTDSDGNTGTDAIRVTFHNVC